MCWLFLVGWGVVACTTTRKDLKVHKTATRTTSLQRGKRDFRCTYRDPRLSVSGLGLRAKMGLLVFATPVLKHNPAEALVRLSTKGPEGGAFVQLRNLGITLHGVSVLPLYSRKSMRLSQIFAISPATKMVWSGYRNKRILLQVPEKGAFLPLKPLVKEFSCAATSIRPRYIPAMWNSPPGAIVLNKPKGPPPRNFRQVFKLKKARKQIWLQLNTPIPISTTPGGLPEGKLTLPYLLDPVDVYEQKNTFLKVLIRFQESGYYGWIPKSLTRSTQQKSGALKRGRGYGHGGSSPKIKLYKCSKVIDLYVKGRAYHEVGKLAPGTPFRLVDKGVTWAQIEFVGWRSWVGLAPQHQWKILFDKLKHCAAVMQSPVE